MTQYQDTQIKIEEMNLQQLCAKKAFVNDRIKSIDKERLDLLTELVLIETRENQLRNN